MNRKLLSAIVGAGLVAVACGPGATQNPTSTATSGAVAGSVASTVPPAAGAATTGPSTSSSAAPSTSLPTTLATTTPTVQCGLIDDLSGATAPIVTFSQDGYLWFVGTDSTDCLADLPDRVGTSPYTWGPAGDKILFADGTVMGVGLDRGPLADLASSLTWTRPTGTSTIHVATDGTLTKTSHDGTSSSTLSPLDTHVSVAYHPDGTTFAVAGMDEVEQGIWISTNDGSEAQLLAFSDVGVVITEMTFSYDARRLVFVADHTNDGNDHGYHLHSLFVEPFEMGDGTMALGSGGEFGTAPHLASEAPIDSIVVPFEGTGAAFTQNSFAFAQGACGPDRRALYLPGPGEDQEAVVLLDAPGFPAGFLAGLEGEHRIVVATSDDGCTGPFDWYEVIVDATTLATTIGLSGTGVDAVAIHSTAPPVDITLSGVLIDPFV